MSQKPLGPLSCECFSRMMCFLDCVNFLEGLLSLVDQKGKDAHVTCLV